jgi:hypothetical protein
LSPGAASRSRSSSPESSSPEKSPLPEPPSAAYKRGRRLPRPPHLTTAVSQQPSPLSTSSTAPPPRHCPHADPPPCAALAQGEHGSRIPAASSPFSPNRWSPTSTGPPAGTPGRPPACPLPPLCSDESRGRRWPFGQRPPALSLFLPKPMPLFPLSLFLFK